MSVESFGVATGKRRRELEKNIEETGKYAGIEANEITAMMVNFVSFLCDTRV